MRAPGHRACVILTTQARRHPIQVGVEGQEICQDRLIQTHIEDGVVSFLRETGTGALYAVIQRDLNAITLNQSVISLS